MTPAAWNRRKASIAWLTCLVILAALGLHLAWRRPPEPSTSVDGGDALGGGAARPDGPSNPGAAANPEPAAEAPPIGPLWIVRGRAVSETGGAVAPVAGAAVELSFWLDDDEPPPGPPSATTTDADGWFQLEMRPLPDSPSRRLRVDAPGFALHLETYWESLLEPRPGEPHKDLGEIVLEPPHALRLEVRGDDGTPVGGARVILEPRFADPSLPSPLPHEGVSGPDGRLVLERLRRRDHELHAWAPGWAPAHVRVVEVPRERPLGIVLEASHFVAGTVRAADDRPIEAAEVGVTSDKLDRETRTDESGAFRLEGLALGRQWIWAAAAGFASAAQELDPDTGDAVFSLFREAVVTGRIISDADGKALARAAVHLRAADGTDSGGDEETDEQGAFEARKLPPGLYEVLAEHEDHAPGRLEPFALEEGARLELPTVRLPPGLTVTGRVVAAAGGSPVPDAAVTLDLDGVAPEDSLSRRAACQASGEFAARGLIPPGTYTVSVRAPDFLPLWTELVLEGEPPDPLLLELEPGGSVGGRVTDADGAPVVRARVILRPP